jgi:putative transposase
MGRPSRAAAGGYLYHVLNRANARMTLFEDAADFDAFEAILLEAVERTETRLLSYCVMPNHWHLVLWPRADGELSRFTGWLTLTHTQRWHAQHGTAGHGHAYQGRFKSFPVQSDEHFHTVCRYVERNPLRARLVKRAEDWRWSSLYRWKFGTSVEKGLLATWPQARRPGWLAQVNAAQTEAELLMLRNCVQRGRPFGDDLWSNRTAQVLGLQSTLRPRGRPRLST